MNNYQKTLYELSKDSSLVSKYNNLMKIYYSTEDFKLKDLIRNYAGVLQTAEEYRKNKLPSHCQNTLSNGRSLYQNLYDYCTEVRMSKKPEWQILAERYNWRPPNK